MALGISTAQWLGATAVNVSTVETLAQFKTISSKTIFVFIFLFDV